jgi:glutamine amidotransferase
MATVIIDYGMGNLDSISRAVAECGGDPLVTSKEADLAAASHIILPGVGSFAPAAKNLAASGLVPCIREQVLTHHIPFMGICLGMHLMADKGYEGGEAAGLGLIPGRVVRLEAANSSEKIPHMGWNEVDLLVQSPLFAGMENGKDFYFVHSYHFVCEPDYVMATTPYCGKINSIVGRDNIIGAQFHPEKSQRAGLKLLSNFIAMR